MCQTNKQTNENPSKTTTTKNMLLHLTHRFHFGHVVDEGNSFPKVGILVNHCGQHLGSDAQTMGMGPIGVSSWEASVMLHLASSDSRLDMHKEEKNKPTLYNEHRRKHYTAVCCKLTGMGRETLCCFVFVCFVSCTWIALSSDGKCSFFFYIKLEQSRETSRH